MENVKLSPFSQIDIARVTALLTKPNIGFGQATPPDDAAFPDSGLIQITGAVGKGLCEQAIAEYKAFETFREERGCAIRDAKGRNYRVNNLHIYSKPYLDIGTTPILHEHVSRFLRRQSCVYTSLAYEHGSQQLPHIDTPFFWTRPFNLYAGVWVALEDVQADAGPLFYYEGSQRYFNSEEELRDVWKSSGGNVDRMFVLIHEYIESKCKRVIPDLRTGDAVIWHPGIVHGGTRATNAQATRFSAVYHFAPVGVNVRDQRVFPGDFANVPTYGLRKNQGQFYARKNMPKVMLHMVV